MSEILKDLLYTKEHEWVRKNAGSRVVQVGITDFAQSSLGDVTYLDAPAVGTTLKQNQVFGSIESVKSVSELFAPVSGKVVKRNEALVEDPAPINAAPFTDGWILEIEVSDESELSKLLSPAAYATIAQ
ncbi:MAG: glycine cleavage system protein GcvH [Bdellovibrionota bacterium]